MKVEGSVKCETSYESKCCLPTIVGSFILYSDNQSKQNKEDKKEIQT